ncbi:SH3 domain-containing protein [Clostridium minihomine]|uniref:SH3 domain-containing protein n=1 Tax=Clostridium minihomine TaxID=2045012 RepID=UPI000C7681E7|nr:SH3 domain-containing protein [Clostridium minihomine]
MPNIYLSPSLQPYNLYVNGGNEQYHMNVLADYMEPYLRANGIQFTRNTVGTSLGQAIRESNAGYYDLHLALHSNAAPPDLAGQLRGADMYYYPYSSAGKQAADVFVKNYKTIYPLPDQVKAVPTTTLAEITKTNAPAVLIETAYHDNVEDADWLVNNMPEIAANLVYSLTEIFGIPFIDNPQPARVATVVTQGGNLNIRSRPNLDAPVIARAPNGSSITVLGEWQGWYVVNFNGTVGYASSQFIQ